MNKSKSVAVVAAALGAAAAAQAQAPASSSTDELRRKAETIFARSDLDKDGKITREEATRSNQPLSYMFPLYDGDRNGEVTPAEVATFTNAVELGTAINKLGENSSQAGLPAKASPQMIMGNNDLNKDGIVTRDEAEKAKGHLIGMWDYYDLDKDGKVDAAELAKAANY